MNLLVSVLCPRATPSLSPSRDAEHLPVPPVHVPRFSDGWKPTLCLSPEFSENGRADKLVVRTPGSFFLEVDRDDIIYAFSGQSVGN